MKLSDALAATQTALLVSQFNGGFLRLFTGSAPANPGAAETGTLLGTVSVNGAAGAGLHFTSNGPTLQKADEAWAFKALADGTVGHARLVQAGDDGTASLTAKRIGITVALPGVPADMNWESLDVLADQFYTIDSFLYLVQPV